MTRGMVKVTHNLTPAQADMVKRRLADLWPGYNIEVKVGYRLWPFQRRLGVKVRFPK